MKRRSKAVWLEIMLLNIVLLNYVCNKMFMQEYTQHWFMRSYWNDVLAGICLAILSDWLTRFWLKKSISVMGIFYIVLGAGIYWEYVGPLYIPYSVSDAGDMIAYGFGSIIYIIFRRIIYRGGYDMYCSHCGSKVEEGTKFCSSCGARLDFAEEPKVEEKLEVKKPDSPEWTSSQYSNSTAKTGKAEKKRSLKKLGLSIVGGVAAIFLILIIIGVFADSGSKDFYDYLPLAKADVEKFLSRENFEKDSSTDLYMKEEDYVILNEQGNIEIISILMPGYAFCDVEVGDTFDVLKDSRKFTDHGYSLLSEDEDTGEICYGLPDGKEELGGDQLISMYLDGNKEVAGILFYRTGAKEFVESLEEDLDTLLETEAETEIVSTTDGNAEYIFADSDKRRLSEEEINSLSEFEKWYAVTEILARHGVDFSTFDDDGLLDSYFRSKSWYHATRDDIDDSELNEYELFNAALIMKCMESTKSEFILPESDARYLTHEDLAGMDSATLRLARNEIFARHGRAFETEDLNEYFSAKSWYYGYLSAEEFDDSVLNEYEKANLDLIKEAETGSSFDENAQKELSGLYEIQFDSYGGAELEIQYYSGEDAYYATLSGSYYDAAGFVEGYLSAYTDGSDGIWELYEPYDTVPVLRLIYDGKDFITIESLNGDTYGGVNFPGFSGTYKRTKEYKLP